MTYTLEEVYDALEQEQLCNIGILIGTLLTGGMLSLGVFLHFSVVPNSKKGSIASTSSPASICYHTPSPCDRNLNRDNTPIQRIHDFLHSLDPKPGKQGWHPVGLPRQSSTRSCRWFDRWTACVAVLQNAKIAATVRVESTEMAKYTLDISRIPMGFNKRSSDLLAPSDALEETALLSNAMLNAYATMFIAVRLLKHKKSLMVSIAREQVKSSRHLEHIVRIFLESAAINVPIAIVTAVGVSSNSVLGSIMTTIMFTCQTLSSIIIIHQVIEGRESSSRNEELSTLKFRVTEGEQPSISDQSKATLTMIDAGAQNV
ncbi:hypothetical protein NP233_g4331 [Leucocoprinus birnbaumii]|uniref:Uncharacterized protein n=1 Tax=Leucocoprinus birnbaumii TaxID=56174 RepID=A0AAD5YXB6_9AGAR|nr:hypothetical protein NP233_g4331 [Leucocoprinus birnbaumii]